MIREAVERASARDAAGEHAILALVEKCAGLLAVPRRGEIAHAVLDDLDLARDVAAQELGRAAEPSFVRTAASLRARMPVGREQLAQRVDDRRAEALEPGAQQLHDEPAIVAIDDERRAARRPRRARRDTRWSCVGERRAARERVRDAVAPPRGVERRGGIAVEEAQRDLGCGAVEGDAEWPAGAVGDDDGAGGCVGRIDEVAAIDPGMTGGPSSAPRAETVARRVERWIERWRRTCGGKLTAVENARARECMRKRTTVQRPLKSGKVKFIVRVPSGSCCERRHGVDGGVGVDIESRTV